MGRKSMVDVRREEIIDAAQACIVEYGLANTTMAKVADHAGMQRSAISHFLGNRDDVIAVTVERSVQHYHAVLAQLVEESTPEQQVDAILDGLIGGNRVSDDAMVLFDEIIGLGHHDEQARRTVEFTFSKLYDELLVGLEAQFPDARPSDRRDTGKALVLLIDNAERFRVLGLTDSKQPGLPARNACRTLLTALADSGSHR
jgi:TetR/AcrR family transcriptional repressor of bet genes